MNPNKWSVRESPGSNDARGWEEDERFHLRYFRALSMTEKIRAVEEMCRTAEALSRNAPARRRRNSSA
jgi:hypothetical protein